MKNLFLIFLLIGCTRSQQGETIREENWISLFNGKDLKGWQIKIAGHPVGDNFRNTVRAENGMLRIMYDQYETFDASFGHVFFETPYSYYKLRLEYRIIGNTTPGSPEWTQRNSGVMIHSQSAASMEIDQDFPVSLEAQLLSRLDQADRPTANLCTPGTQVHIGDSLRQEHCINSSSPSFGEEWVSIQLEVYGDSLIRHMVDGEPVLTYTKPIIGGGFVNASHTWEDGHIENSSIWINKEGTPLKEGYIALQAEGHPVDFRNIEILNLEKPNP